LAPDRPPEVDPSDWGFDFDSQGDSWLENVRRAEAPRALGAIGPYELESEVSRGGQGIVFRARQPGTNRTVAIKRLLAGSFSTASMRHRFEREIEATAALSHPNIVTVYGMDVVDGQPIFAMEWVDGVPATVWAAGVRTGEPEAQKALYAGPCRDPEETLELFLRISDAVQHAHARGILHRDLKPSNVLVDDSGQPHVLDFGLAKRFDDQGEEAAGVTRTGEFLGTPTHAAPEQLRGERLDERADVYALGVLLFEMLTGECPFDTKVSLTDLVRSIETEEPPRPSGRDARLGLELDTIVRKAMAKDREERYSTAREFAGDVRRFLAGEPVLALPSSTWYLVRKLVTRKPVGALAILGLLLLFVGFAGYESRQARQLRVQSVFMREERDAAIRMTGEANRAADALRNALNELADDRGGQRQEAAELFLDGSPCPPEVLGTPNPDYSPESFGIEVPKPLTEAEARLLRTGT
jgi:serine/threonine protein kinase